jgi:2-oxo-4-hydroxy-4-carboxy-5-ureidoimidazoline decarboxylase
VLQSGGREGSEQAGVRTAGASTLAELHELNLAYEDKFGFVFLICATGKSAEEMLEILKGRILNEKSDEVSSL